MRADFLRLHVSIEYTSLSTRATNDVSASHRHTTSLAADTRGTPGADNPGADNAVAHSSRRVRRNWRPTYILIATLDVKFPMLMIDHDG